MNSIAPITDGQQQHSFRTGYKSLRQAFAAGSPGSLGLATWHSTPGGFRCLFHAMLICLLGAGGGVVTAADLPLPQKTGESFLVEDFDFKVTKSSLGVNYFAGNMGSLNGPSNQVATLLTLSTQSSGTVGGSLQMVINFTNSASSNQYGGWFAHLFGLSDTKLRLDGQRQEPPDTTRFPGYWLDFDNLFGSIGTMQNRSAERLLLDAKLGTNSAQVSIKLELKDDGTHAIYARRPLASTNWVTLSLRRSDFDRGVGSNDVANFDWTKVRFFSVIVERSHAGDGVSNPNSATFLLDNLRLVDDDGLYPNLAAIANSGDGSLRPEYARAFLDLVRQRSFQYFMDFASTDTRTGGAIQDRGPFADLMTIGGVGFQLSAYVVGAERGYITRTNAADRTVKLLRFLRDAPQDSARVGSLGYRGFFYHFLGIDGRRKQNFDFTATGDVDESRNTVELSTIDTALALMGVITCGRYYDRSDPVEGEIRTLAEAIFARVDWPFMLRTVADGKKQFALAWKPNETRDDTSGSYGRFLLNDGFGTGQFSSKSELAGAATAEVAATLDYYTDEAVLIILLAMASPDPAHRVGRAPWDDLKRDGVPFVKTYPGSLFTYQFASPWLDTFRLGWDNHVLRPVNFFDNTRSAILAARQYAAGRPSGLPSPAIDFWGWSACEGPFGYYSADAVRTNALGSDGGIIAGASLLIIEGETMQGGALASFRSNASGGRTLLLTTNAPHATGTLNLPSPGTYTIQARYSNDGRPDVCTIRIDGQIIGSFNTSDTRALGGESGSGWNNFMVTNGIQVMLAAGSHEFSISVNSDDQYGVELDWIGLALPAVVRPHDVGVLTVYGVGSSIVHTPTEALSALWAAARLDLNQDGRPDLFHPRFGFADAFSLNISNVVSKSGDANILRQTGAWLNHTGFAIDHGPMLLLIDNYLSGNFLPKLFMSHPRIQDALATVFPSQRNIRKAFVTDTTVSLEWAGFDTAVVVERNLQLSPAQWSPVTGTLSTNQTSVPRGTEPVGIFRLRFP